MTLQTVVPGEKPITADLVRTLKETVWNLPATSVQGSRLEAIYSGFYGYWIAKLRVPATSELRQARLAIQSVVERNGLRGLIPAPEDGGLIYLTVVDSLDPPDSRWDLSVSPPAADLAKPIMISLNALRITRVISSSEYELLESWKLC